MPPRLINYAGGGDFRAIGAQQVALLRERAQLRAGEAVLDVGCGIGRLAVALADIPDLRYSGFDVVRFGITWCGKRFRDRASFRFDHLDVHNGFYNPRGRLDPLSLRFPYPDASFDLAVATSVFTHMPMDQVAHYLKEMARCLRPGGRAYVTLFALDEASLMALSEGRAAIGFDHPVERGRTHVPDRPEVAMALEADALEQAVRAAGSDPERFFPGSWRGTVAADFQDAWLLHRPDQA